MCSRVILAILLAMAAAAGLATLRAPTATAQYLYLDADGDSLNTGWEWPDPDTATVDLYLVTNATLSGEPAPCGSGALDLLGYNVALEGPDAPFTLLSVENLLPGMAEAFPPEVHPHGLTFGYVGDSVLSAGRHRLLRLRLLFDRWGCPTLAIVSSSCHTLPGVTTSMVAYFLGAEGHCALPLEGLGMAYCTDPPNQRPTVSAPDCISGMEGAPIRFTIDVTDVECGEGTYLFSYYANGVPTGATVSGLSPFAYGEATSTFSWTPEVGQSGIYAVEFVVHDPDTWNWWIDPDVEATTTIAVAPAIPTSAERAPTARAGGPYSGQIGAPIEFDGAASSDPGGQALVYSWSFGDGGTAHGPTVEHAFEWSGLYEVALTVTTEGGLSDTDVTAASISNTAPADRRLLGPIAPNPVTTASVVAFTTTREGSVSLRLFDVRGRVVARLFETPGISAGTYRVSVIGPGTVAKRLPSGVYFLQLRAEHDGEVTRRLTLLR